MKLRHNSIFVLLSLLLILSCFQPIVGHAGDENMKHTALYNVISANDTTYTWFNADFSESFNYTVQLDSEINVELANPTDINSNLNITIGNLNRTSINDKETASNLGTGYYSISDKFGFIASTSWMDTESLLSSQNFTEYSLEMNQEYQFGAANFTAVEISFTDGFQSTELIYNQATGLLYYANVSINNFQLEFEITGYIPGGENENHNVPFSSEEETEFQYIGLIVSLMSLSILIRKR